MATGPKSSLSIFLSMQERETLEIWQRSTKIPSGLAKRSKIILLLEDEKSQSKVARIVGVQRCIVRKWAKRFLAKRINGLFDKPGRGVKGLFPPEVAVHVVKIACERPDKFGRSISQWDCQELARQLVDDGIIESISVSTIQRILAFNTLKPWRNHMWLNPKKIRDETFYKQISDVIELYTRALSPNEIVLSVDEKTSLQPRPRSSKTKPAKPGNKPNQVEHEYKRDGALNLFAAFDTRSGLVYGKCYSRKRQIEYIDFLEYIDFSIDQKITKIHIICDNVSVHHGKKVQAWVKKHPRFSFQFTPVHCSWMNQVEQWFSILQRKRFRIADFASKKGLST